MFSSGNTGRQIFAVGLDSFNLRTPLASESVEIPLLQIIRYPSGLGYEYSPGTDLKNVKDLAGDFLKAHKASIDCVSNSFSGKTTSELELLSTILFVAKFQNPKTVAKLLEQVELIKPHFS